MSIEKYTPSQTQAFATAWRLIVNGDAALLEIVLLSLRVTAAAVVLAALVGLPLGRCSASRASRAGE